MNKLGKELCYGCSACAYICPKNCINMEADGQGFIYPKVDSTKCINCDLCKKVCPYYGIVSYNCEVKRVYACKSKDYDNRIKSSSGGVFPLIAAQVIRCGGVVFGARWSADLNYVVHDYALNLEEIDKFRGSKYMESVLGDAFKNVKSYLDDNRQVLFTGTPCQIAGLKGFLKRDYNNLITIDVICTGIPSALAYQFQIKELEQRHAAKLQYMDFRNKDTGWSKYIPKIYFDNGESITPHTDDSFKYYLLFLGEPKIMHRLSCYNCQFKGNNFYSDITLGDYWQPPQSVKHLDDDYGLSAVILRTEKGIQWFDSIASEVDVQESCFKDVAIGNPWIMKVVPRHKNREQFYNDLSKMKFSKAAEKNYFGVNQRIKINIKRIVKKIKRCKV